MDRHVGQLVNYCRRGMFHNSAGNSCDEVREPPNRPPVTIKPLGVIIGMGCSTLSAASMGKLAMG